MAQDNKSPMITVIIPAYNEAKTIKQVLIEVDNYLSDYEALLIDDGSIDNTLQLAKQVQLKNGTLKTFQNDRNRGKGYSVRRGIKESSGEIVCIQDADLEYDPSELPELIKPLTDQVADVVFGTRMRSTKTRRVYRMSSLLANQFLSFLTSLLWDRTVSDMETCYKIFRGDLVRSFQLKSNDFRIEPELTANVISNNEIIFLEMPISYYPRTLKEGKKIRWRDGFLAVAALIKLRVRL